MWMRILRKKPKKKNLKAVCYSKGSYYPHASASYDSESNSYQYYNGCEYLDQCKRGYSKIDSKNTREYREQSKTKFTGCQRLEDRLRELGEVVPMMREIYDDVNEVREIAAKLSYDNEMLFFLLECAKELNVFIDQEAVIKYFSAFKKSPQNNIEMMILRKMLAKGAYEEDLETLLIARLWEVGLNDYHDLLEFFPLWDKTSYHRKRWMIDCDIKKHIPVRFLIMRDALQTLTLKQRNAIKAYITDNEDRRSLEQVAKTMKISRDSLYDRIVGAKKKIEKYITERLPDWEELIYLRN